LRFEDGSTQVVAGFASLVGMGDPVGVRDSYIPPSSDSVTGTDDLAGPRPVTCDKAYPAELTESDVLVAGAERGPRCHHFIVD